MTTSDLGWTKKPRNYRAIGATPNRNGLFIHCSLQRAVRQVRGKSFSNHVSIVGQDCYRVAVESTVVPIY
jgi:hypothetical protein